MLYFTNKHCNQQNPVSYGSLQKENWMQNIQIHILNFAKLNKTSNLCILISQIGTVTSARGAITIYVSNVVMTTWEHSWTTFIKHFCKLFFHMNFRSKKEGNAFDQMCLLSVL